MYRPTFPPAFATLCLLSLASAAVPAAPAWVTDVFEITLRTGPSTSNAIERMLRSGTEVEILERDAQSGYARVRTRGGTEGWVLSRYLMDEPAARQQLAALTEQLTDAAETGSSLTAQLDALRDRYARANARIATLEQEKSRLEAELAEVRRTAADTLAINARNDALTNELASTRETVASLEQQNRRLADENMRYWFLSGAGVLLFGMILGLWLPRVRWRRESRYGRL